MIDSYKLDNRSPQIKDAYSNRKMENIKNYFSTSNILSYNQLEYMDKDNIKSSDSINYNNRNGNKSIDSRNNLWSSQCSVSSILNNSDFSYRNEKKYYHLLEKHRIRQDKIRKLSTRSSNNHLNNEFGIINKTDTSDRLPKITKASYQVLSGFCQRNCPLPSAKEIININFNENFDRESRKNHSSKHHRHHLKKTVSYPITKSQNIHEKVNHNKNELENTIIQKSLQNLVNCARRTGRGLFCGV
ncbi:hypothetical protein BCR32DRAFT_246045 [Anaeromyces robustus]|uniref:Uncharacterized protein n=1 Tax=Anaeromyces robustus TaxID=1754192 RepID=A0A1Y1X2E0_9FUNG|nr:hypothetical protein BCR32DRAFT_246045 [Anaeromyces robustus]|eukprot:ORX79835.1 hypothetical protein BCR32DRAFT_246045 [Anaeromyces robustus]